MIHLFGKQTCRSFITFFPNFRAIKTTDRMFGRNMTVGEPISFFFVAKNQF
jgi:hypothetical protein